MLSTRNPKPLFVQLFDEIREEIEDGTRPVGSRLPAERLLANQNGISRDTARKAVVLLRERGYINTRHGKGAYIVPRQRHMARGSAIGFSELLLRQGKRVTSKTLCCDVIEAGPDIVSAFGDPRLNKVVRLERLRFVDGSPVSLDCAYLRYPLCAGIMRINLDRRSLYAVLDEELGVILHSVRDTITRASASEEELQLMQVDNTDVLFRRQRTSLDDDGSVVEVVDSLCLIEYLRPSR